jgi:hypothetical protein
MAGFASYGRVEFLQAGNIEGRRRGLIEETRTDEMSRIDGATPVRLGRE